jgi:aryl-alcohol dehydrogenase-like predicted oxidoreductase
MGLQPWGALGGGNFKTVAQRASSNGRKLDEPSTDTLKISAALEAVANRKKTAITSIALAYVMHKAPYVFPIVGGRTIEHIKGNIEALEVELSTEDIKEIEEAIPFCLGFPHTMIGTGPEKSWLCAIGGKVDYVAQAKVCGPAINWVL